MFVYLGVQNVIQQIHFRHNVHWFIIVYHHIDLYNASVDTLMCSSFRRTLLLLVSVSASSSRRHNHGT